MIIADAFAQNLQVTGFPTPIKGLLPVDKVTQFSTLGGFVGSTLDLVFAIAFFLAFFWMVWGAFQYLFSQGDKEGLAKARARMISAVVGLLLLAISFAVAQYVERILQPASKSPLALVQTAYAARDNPSGSSISGIYDFGRIGTLGQGVNLLVAPTFTIATIAVVIYFLIGAVKYLVSGGDKNAVAGGKNMITHAIVGFLLLMLVFIILQFIPRFFGINFYLF